MNSLHVEVLQRVSIIDDLLDVASRNSVDDVNVVPRLYVGLMEGSIGVFRIVRQSIRDSNVGIALLQMPDF